jgi:hypothetical protein
LGVSALLCAAITVVVLIAGALQFSAWKARHLACCRKAPARGAPDRERTELEWNRQPGALSAARRMRRSPPAFNAALSLLEMNADDIALIVRIGGRGILEINTQK